MANDNLRDLAASASQALERVGLDGLKAEVVLVVDVSRSMFPIYRARVVQAVSYTHLTLPTSDLV